MFCRSFYHCDHRAERMGCNSKLPGWIPRGLSWRRKVFLFRETGPFAHSETSSHSETDAATVERWWYRFEISKLSRRISSYLSWRRKVFLLRETGSSALPAASAHSETSPCTAEWWRRRFEI